MRSPIALVAAATTLLTIPLAIAAGAILHVNGDDVVHFGVGTGFVLLAIAMRDFGLARPITVIGAAAAAAFGGIFLLQGISNILALEPLQRIAFDVLGHEIERVLPEFVFIWFVALLLTGTEGRSRFIGWAIVPLVLGFEVATFAAPLVGLTVPKMIVVLFLPLVWLLVEAVKPAPGSGTPVSAPAPQVPQASAA